jgi:hypothetical protein
MLNKLNEDELELVLQLNLDPVIGFPSIQWPTQKRCYDSKARYRWIGGGNRRGKSGELAFEAAAVARRMHATRSVNKATTGLILAPSREQLQDPWEKKLLQDCELPGFAGRPLIPAWEIEKVWYTHGAGAPTLRQINLKNGNIIRFGVSKDPESWKRRAGQQLAWIILDESEGNVSLLNELYPRLLDANKDPDIVAQAGGGWILWGATPTTANAALTKFIADCDDPKLEDWAGFRLSDDDGSEIDRVERERLRPAFSDDDYELRMRGTTSFVDRLLIYGKQWDEARIMLTQDYVPQRMDNIWVGYDPGGAGKESHDTGIMFTAISQDEPRTIKVWRYLRLNRTTLGFDVDLIAKVLRGRSVEGFVPDPSINKTEKGTGKSLRMQLKEELAKQKIVVHRGLIHVLNRHDPGIKRVQTYMEQGLFRISPSPQCGGQIVRGQFVGYRSYEPGVYQGAKGVVKIDDEAPDTARYIVMAAPRWVPRGCGGPQWEGPEKPLPPPPPPPPELSQDQINFQLQMERSARLVGPMFRRRYRN